MTPIAYELASDTYYGLGVVTLCALFSTCEGTPKLLSFLQSSHAVFCPLDLGPINLANEGTPEGIG